MKNIIPNQAIFCGPNSLFILDGDQNLIEINGESSTIIKEILVGICQDQSLDDIFKNHKEAFENDHESFKELIDWLLDKQLIQQPSSPQKIKIHLLIDSIPSTQSTYIINALNDLSANQVEYILEESIQESDLILFIGSLFTQRKNIKELAKLSYESNIPLLYSELDHSSFSLGPIIFAELLSPCLDCYADRKQVQLKNPKAFSNLQKTAKKEFIFTPLLKDKLYFPAFLNFINHEIQKFFYSKLTFSNLLGQSFLIHANTFEIKKTKILKVPHCPICSKKNQSMIFNM